MLNDNTIKDIGSYFKIDSDGFIINPCSENLIQEEFKEPLSEAIEHAKKNPGDNIHSIYLRGSVPKGTAIKNISDIDLIIVTEKEVTDTDWKEVSSKEICKLYPYVRGIEFHLETTEYLSTHKSEQFLLQTQSIKVFGRDFDFPQASFKLGRESYGHIFFIEKDIQDFYEEFPEESNEDAIDTCEWITKRIVRTGFEIVMRRENLYTRDLYPCYKSFIKYYPESKEKMYEVLKLAVYPVAEKEKIIKAVKDIEQKIISESRKIRIKELSDTKIRQANENDCEEIGKLYFDTVRTINAKDYSDKEIEIWSESGKNTYNWKRKISEQYFLVAEFGKKIVGISSIDEKGYLDYMYVHKDFQHMGIATRLLKEIEAKAIEQNNPEIWAYVSITANPFFEKYGYVFSGTKIITVRGVEFVDRIMKRRIRQ